MDSDSESGDDVVNLQIDSGDELEEDAEEEQDQEDLPKRSWAKVMDDEEDEDDDDDDDEDEEEELDEDDEEDDEEEDEEEDDIEEDIDAASDSSEDERPNLNTIGEVPLEWYAHERHIGYDVDGKAVIKVGESEPGSNAQGNVHKGDTLDFFLNKQDGKLGLRSREVWDEYNQRVVELTKEEMQAIRRMRKGMFPHVSVDPYPPLEEWSSKDRLDMPLTNFAEPKRRFLPSKWEALKVIKLVRAMRKGWITPPSLQKKEEKDENSLYMLWSDNSQEASAKAANGLSYVPASKPKLPGHAGSYRPPPEYIEEDAENDDEKLNTVSYDCLRKVPAYSKFVNDRFERCLDLYLCPRMRSRKGKYSAEKLKERMEAQKQKLPKPKDLQPFPRTLVLEYEAHKGAVRTLAVDNSGYWMASGGDDEILRFWEISTTRCIRKISLKDSTKAAGKSSIQSLSWCPARKDTVLFAKGTNVYVMSVSLPGLDTTASSTVISNALRSFNEANAESKYKWSSANLDNSSKKKSTGDFNGLHISLSKSVRHCCWHHKGDYFATVCPSANNVAVLVHQLSKGATQTPFNKSKGRVVSAEFHPSKPIIFVATENHIRAYHLVKQELVAKLVSGAGTIMSMALHPLGDNMIVGTSAGRVEWFDLDLSGHPYKVIRNHRNAVETVAFHKHYPLFASGADDGAVHIFHGRVYNDFENNPLIVPVKILNAHSVEKYLGVLDCVFHPNQPWIFTAGADGKIKLFVN